MTALIKDRGQFLEHFLDRPSGFWPVYEHVLLYDVQEVVQSIRAIFLSMQIKEPLQENWLVLSDVKSRECPIVTHLSDRFFDFCFL